MSLVVSNRKVHSGVNDHMVFGDEPNGKRLGGLRLAMDK